jgi:hypothetical protein
VAGAASYDLYTKIGGVETTTNYLAATVCSAGTCSVTSPALANGTSVYWVARARNVAGTSPWSSSMSFSVKVLPLAPTLIGPSGSGTATPTFTWNAVGNATSYTLYTNVGGVENYATYDAAAACSTGVCSVTPGAPLAPFSAGSNVYWVVRGGNAAGNGPWSANKTFKVQ